MITLISDSSCVPAGSSPMYFSNDKITLTEEVYTELSPVETSIGVFEIGSNVKCISQIRE